MQALLSGWGVEVLTASGRTEAQRLLRRGGTVPDLILVDYHLDDGDGLQTISEIRSRLRREIPAILITADRSAEVRAAAQGIGVRVLHKPLKPAALRASMAQLAALRTAAE
jgi:CheY-like chemotaxis protein